MKKGRMWIRRIGMCLFMGFLLLTGIEEAKGAEISDTEQIITEIMDYDVYSGKPYLELCSSEEDKEKIKEELPECLRIKTENGEEREVAVDWLLDTGEAGELKAGLNILEASIKDEGYQWSDALFSENDSSKRMGCVPFVTVQIQKDESVSEASYDAALLANARIFYSVRSLGLKMQFGAGANGGMVGTVGKSYGIEGIFMRVDGNSDLGIQYRVYSAQNGWSNWQQNGDYAGTTSWTTPISYIQLQLIGNAAEEYQLDARIHISNTGWKSYSASGQTSLQVGNGNQIEAVEFCLKVKDTVQKTGYHLTACSGCKTYVCQMPNLYLKGEGTDHTLAEFRYVETCQGCGVGAMYLYNEHWYTSCMHDTSYVRRGVTQDGYCTRGHGGGNVWGSRVESGNRNTNDLYGHAVTYCVKHNTPNTYTVSYDGNGATGGTTASSTHTYDSSKTLSANGFYKTGYDFSGWALSANGSKAYGDQQSVLNLTAVDGGRITLYAVWQKKSYRNEVVSWATGFRHGEGNNDTKTMYRIGKDSFVNVYESSFWLRAEDGAAVPNGFRLDTVFGTSGITADYWQTFSMPYQGIQPAQSIGVEYYYYPEEYLITYQLHGGRNSEANPSVYNVLYGVTFEEPKREHYQFNGWEVVDEEGVLTEKCITGINEGADASFAAKGENPYDALKSRTTGDVTVSAIWELVSYMVHYDGNGNTGGSSTTGEYLVGVEMPLAPNSFEKTGYTFTGWNTKADGTGISYQDEEMILDIAQTDAITLYAQWEIAKRQPSVVCNVRKSELWDAQGEAVFLFKLEGKDVEGEEHCYYTTIVFREDEKYESSEEMIQAEAVFKDVLAGMYRISQEEVNRWQQKKVTEGLHCNAFEQTAEYDLIHYETAQAIFENEKYEWQGYSDTFYWEIGDMDDER